MLARKHYTREEIDRGRERIEAGIAAWSALPAEGADGRLGGAYFEALGLALDRLFVHRQRGLEGRPPTALGEVRDTAEAIAAGQDGPGGRAAFEDLARRFFAGLEARF